MLIGRKYLLFNAQIYASVIYNALNIWFQKKIKDNNL